MLLKLRFSLFALFFSILTLAQNINQPTDFEVCDDDNDGFASFDLSFKDPEILNGLNPSGYAISYHETIPDADNSTNAIPVFYTNVSNPQTIFVRVEDLNDGSFQTTSFDLIVNPSVDTRSAIEWEFCASEENPSENIIDLTFFNLAILNGIDPAEISISFYYTQSGANGAVNEIINPETFNHEFIQLIFARSENSSGCFKITTFYLDYEIIPILNEPQPFTLCNENSSGFEEFDLANKIPEILNGNSTNIYSVSFHATESEAQDGLNNLPFLYTNTSAFTETIFARVFTEPGCFQTIPLTLIIEDDCFESESVETIFCKRFSNSTEFVDLTQQEASLILNQNLDDFSFDYFTSEQDAINQTNLIDNPDSFGIVNPDVIFVRITTVGSQYFAIETITINIGFLPPIILNESYSICEEDTFIVNATSFIIDSFDFEWSNGSTEPELLIDTPGIYSVTVTNTDTGCSSYIEFEVIEVDSISIQPPSDIEICTENSFFCLELEQNITEAFIDGNSGPYNIDYYETELDMINETNRIEYPNDYCPPVGVLEIFVRVSTSGGSCFATTQFNVIIEYCPTIVYCSNEPVNMQYCYENFDNRQFIFQSSDDQPLTVIFNSGQTEVDYDAISIFDSDGLLLNAALPYGNNGDFTGLTYTSTGGTLTVAFDSDVTINCSSENYTPFDFDVFCSASVGIIEVSAFVDTNQNSSFDDGEQSFTNGFFTYEKNNNGIMNAVSSSTGRFNIVSESEIDTYDITYAFYDETSNCYEVNTTLFENLSVDLGSTVSFDFAVNEDESCEDLAVYLINSQIPPRPGFTYTNEIIFENLGFAEILSGSFEFTFDNQLEYSSVLIYNPAYNITENANGFTLEFTNLLALEQQSVLVYLYCPTNVSLGDIVTNTATYVTDTNDAFAGNNTSSLSEEVVGSFDPNDKMESHGPQIIL